MGTTTPSTVSRDARDARTSIANENADDETKTSSIGVVTTRYEAFHARVDAVFAEVGRRPSTKTSRGDVDGVARGGSGASSEAWRPRDEAVVRTGTGTASDDEDDEDDDRGTGRRAIDDDIDCLESDEDEDDDARRMRRLRASVGRCRALEREDDFDAADAAAMGDDARAVMRGAFERTGGESSSRAVPHHLAHPEKYTRYDLGDDAPTVGVPATEPELAGEEPSRNARDERPNTPNARAETSSRDATPRPRFSREAAAKARRPKRRREEDASRARVAFHENDDEDETREGGDDANDAAPFDPPSRRPRRFRRK
jgi:hypothetical protein|tara:strand:+ start:9191 stop:10132 length:942 start_codon:yes stop_codon:yes gene_type:complete